MANNELSGPVVTTFLARWLSQLEQRKYSCRIVLVPETIGSIVYLSQHLQLLQKQVIAGFNITCVGDDRTYSYLPSRQGNTLADQVAQHVLKHLYPGYIAYSFLDRGSDERQYCSPGIDLPVCSMMRSKYACYPEYHTSLDDLTLVTPKGLAGGYEVHKKAIQCLEMNERLQQTMLCEPQLGKRGLYPTISTKESGAQVRDMMNFLAYCDGSMSALDIADQIKVPLWTMAPTIEKLKAGAVLTSRHAS
jgi:aminopeptidase-like protein